MEPKYYANIIKPLFEHHGLNVCSIESYPANARDSTPVCYKCICGESIEKSIRVLKNKPYCKNCTPAKLKATTIPSRNKFIALLESENYELLEPEKFINTKSLLNVRDPNGNIYETSQNRFATGHRSPFIAIENQKISLEQVKTRIVNAGFIWLENTVYKDSHTPMELQCHCGELFEVELNNIRENRVGCPECYRFNRTYNWEYIEGFADKYGCIIETDKKEYKGRETFINVICACDAIFCKNVRNFLDAPRCLTCSTKSRDETNLRIYGTKNYLASDEGKEKIKQYYTKHYGVTHNMQVPEIQQKAQETCLENFGVKCILSTKKVREKGRTSRVDKYNGEYFQSDTYKQLMLELYGVEHNMQDPEIFKKAQKSAFRSKPYIFPSGKIVDLQGYEWRCMNYLLSEKKINENDIIIDGQHMPVVMYKIENDPRKRRYHMDAYIESKNKAIEVKSTYTYLLDSVKNKAKWIAASYKCKGGIDIYIFDKKSLLCIRSIKLGEIVKERIFTNLMPFKHIFGEFI